MHIGLLENVFMVGEQLSFGAPAVMVVWIDFRLLWNSITVEASQIQPALG